MFFDKMSSFFGIQNTSDVVAEGDVPRQVVFSERAFTALMSETLERIQTETGGVFLGHREKDIWYVVESIDPGPRAIFGPAYFEYDQDYINHIINKVNKIYRKPLDVVGLWHRHPGSLDTFSSADDVVNSQYAKLNKRGTISALVNIDPNFRFTAYLVTNPLAYTKINYVVGDLRIPRELLILHPRNELECKINNFWRKSIKITIERALDYSLSSLSNYREQILSHVTSDENDIDVILEYLQDDLEYFEEAGISCGMCSKGIGTIDILEETPQRGNSPLRISFFINRTECLPQHSGGEMYAAGTVKKISSEKLLFMYKNNCYAYFQGLFRRICEEYAKSRRSAI